MLPVPVLPQDAGAARLSRRARLREDGPPTLLCELPAGGLLVLDGQAGRLAVRRFSTAGWIEITESRSLTCSVWDQMHAGYGVYPGRGNLRRYWVIVEMRQSREPLYGCYDLLRWETLAWTLSEDEAALWVESATAGGPPPGASAVQGDALLLP